MRRVVIIGGGNLAESVALAVSQCTELSLEQIYVRSSERGAELNALTGAPTTSNTAELATADLYILAVSDGAIAHLSENLPFAAGAIVAHTAGSTPLGAIDSALRRAVFYPMQSFTRGRRVDFSRVPIFVEADDDEILMEVEKIARLLSQSVYRLSSEHRQRLHLSAVFVSNFVNAMYIAGEELVGASGLPFDVLKPLIEEVTSKATTASSPRDVQSGPAVRGDRTTIEQHCDMLDTRENLQEIYKDISKYIWETLKKI